jgi:hypothetical protein
MHRSGQGFGKLINREKMDLKLRALARSSPTTPMLIPNRFQDETNALVFWDAGGVARSLQTPAGMRLARALPASQNPARLSLILKAHWNYC